jgi:hypothetical protein
MKHYSETSHFIHGLVVVGIHVALLVALIYLSFLVTVGDKYKVQAYDYLIVGSLLLGVAFFTLWELLAELRMRGADCKLNRRRIGNATKTWTPVIVHLAILALAIYYLVRALQNSEVSTMFDLSHDVPASFHEVYGVAIFAMVIVLIALLWRPLYYYFGWM